MHETSIPGVKVVTNVLSDPAANPSQVVAAQRQVIAAARGRFDVILLDTAPLLTANDAVELVGSADLVLLVAAVERTRFDARPRRVELLNRLDAPLGGVVLVGRQGGVERLLLLLPTGRIDAQARRRPPSRPVPRRTGNGAAVDHDVFGDAGGAVVRAVADPRD